MFNLLYHPELIYKMTNNYKIEKQNLQVIYNLTNKIIEEKKDSFLKNNILEQEELDEFKTPQIFLEELFKLKALGHNEIDDENIREQVDTMIITVYILKFFFNN